jgi:Stage II sporulation protein E (SpoIIE)
VSPVHSPRRPTRAPAVRALAGAAVFCALAIPLIAATAAGPLANAKATETGAPPQGTPDPALAPEPVLGAEQVAPEPPPVPDPPPAAEPDPAAEPAPAAERAPAADLPPAAEPAPAADLPPAAEPAPAAAEKPPEKPVAPPAEDRAGQPAATDPVGPRVRGSEEDEAREDVPPEPGAPRGEDSERGGQDEEPSRRKESPESAWPGDGDALGESQGWQSPDNRWSGGEYQSPSPDNRWSGGEYQSPSPDNRWSGGEYQSPSRRSNLSGAIGDLGGGGKEVGSIGGPGLRSPVGRPPPPTTPPEPPAFEQLPVDAGSSSSAAPAPSASPPPTGSGTTGSGKSNSRPRLLERRSGRLVPVSAPVAVPGSGGTTGVTPGGTVGAGPTGGGSDVGDAFVPAPAAEADAIADRIGRSAGGGDGSANAEDERLVQQEPSSDDSPVIIRPVERLANNVPDALKYALAALAALAVMLGVGYLLATMRARSLARQRRELLQEVGLLQGALLPPVPEKLGSLRTSVAYRPADGPGAGGDFYDVLPLAGGSVGFILGDVSGHGRGALARTAFMRYTLRAYLEAGLEPRAALQVAGRVIDENLGGDFATVLLAVHDPETGSLTYATAGHPAPIVVGPETFHPVTAGSSPPIGVGVPTGLRQTTVPLVPGAVACLFTDGLMDARVGGGVLGRHRLEELLHELGDDATARELIERVSQESRVLSDDIAAVVVSPTNGAVAASPFRTEQLELTTRELEGPIAHRFLESCGVSRADADGAVNKARALAGASGAVVLNVAVSDSPRVEVLPRDVDSIEAASQRASAR